MPGPTPPTHRPVLLDAVLDGLNPRPGAALLDGTLGAGGHSSGWLARTAPGGRVLGLDRDPAALEIARDRLVAYSNRVIIVHASYASMSQIAARHDFAPADAILLDLGFSSLQVDDPARGFSFLRDGPLDMRYDPTHGPTAANLVNGLSESELADLIYRYGEDRHARRIARAIVRVRPLHTTTGLAAVIAAAVPRSGEKIHPATRAFQALRIAVNGELDELESALPQTLDLLRPGGRLAVISFHSLEDRIVKTFLKREATACLCPPRQPVCTCGHVAALKIVTRKPITATEDEIAANPRARSAKLRVAERV